MRLTDYLPPNAPESGTVRIPSKHTVRTLLGTFAWLRDGPESRKVQPDLWTSPEPMDLGAFRAWFLRKLHQKINRNEPPRGRKDSPDWFRMVSGLARKANGRYVLRRAECPREFRERLEHRFEEEELR